MTRWVLPRSSVAGAVAASMLLGWSIPTLHAQAPPRVAPPEEAPPADASLEVETATQEPSEAAPPVRQDSPPHIQRAREHIARGSQLLQEENYDAGLVELQRAYDLVGDHPLRFLILFNIARAHELRFRYDLAIEFYRRYLSEGGPEVELRARVEATLTTLEGLLATIELETNVPGAEVWVDDRQMGTAASPILVPAGRHRVELRHRGYEPLAEEVQIAARERRTLSMNMTPLAEEFGGVSPIWFWGLVGAGSATLLGSIVTGTLTVLERSSADSQLDDPVRRLDGGELEDRQSRIKTLSVLTDVLWGSAVLLGATAFVLAFFTDWDASEIEEGSAFRLIPSLGIDGAAMTGEVAF